jgi:predicted dehydrogenase
MSNIGIVGLGFMGRMHLGCWSRLGGIDITAVCDSNVDITKEADKVIGNIEGLPEDIDYSQIKFYSKYDEFLQAEDLDAISLTVPTFLHAEMAIKALEAGVHVLCEKPMALSLEECDRMIAAAKESSKQLLIGHCIRFWPEYVVTKTIIDSGKYGKIQAGHFKRYSSLPTWSTDNWIINADQSGGMPLDLHIHDTDYVHYLLGVPEAVSSRSISQEGKIVHIDSEYIYDDEKVVTAKGSWKVTESFGFQMAFDILLEEATICYDCKNSPSLTVYPSGGEAFSPDVPEGDGYQHQIKYFADLIGGHSEKLIITPAESKDSVRIVEAEKKSAKTGQKVYL